MSLKNAFHVSETDKNRFRVTFSKSLIVYAENKKAALEGACAEVRDNLIDYGNVKDYLHAKVWFWEKITVPERIKIKFYRRRRKTSNEVGNF